MRKIMLAKSLSPGFGGFEHDASTASGMAAREIERKYYSFLSTFTNAQPLPISEEFKSGKPTELLA